MRRDVLIREEEWEGTGWLNSLVSSQGGGNTLALKKGDFPT